MALKNAGSVIGLVLGVRFISTVLWCIPAGWRITTKTSKVFEQDEKKLLEMEARQALKHAYARHAYSPDKHA